MKKPGGERPGYLMNMQPMMSLHTGAILQTAERVRDLEHENETLRARVTALEARG
jgi:hypothetical protein